MNKETQGRIVVTMVAGILTVFMIGCGNTPVTSIPSPQISIGATATPGVEENLKLDDSNPYEVEDEYLTGTVAPAPTKAEVQQGDENGNIPLDPDNEFSVGEPVVTETPESTENGSGSEGTKTPEEVTPSPVPTPIPTQAPEEVTKVPEVTEEDPTPTPPRYVTPTVVPMVTSTPEPTKKVESTESSSGSEVTKTPKPTPTPKPTETPKVTEKPKATSTPTPKPTPTEKPKSTSSSGDKLKPGQKTGETITNNNGDVIEVIHHVAGDEFNAIEDGLEKDASYRIVNGKKRIFEYVCKGKYSGKFDEDIFYIDTKGNNYAMTKSGYKIDSSYDATKLSTPYEVQVAVSDGSLKEIYGDEIPGGFY